MNEVVSMVLTFKDGATQSITVTQNTMDESNIPADTTPEVAPEAAPESAPVEPAPEAAPAEVAPEEVHVHEGEEVVIVEDDAAPAA